MWTDPKMSFKINDSEVPDWAPVFRFSVAALGPIGLLSSVVLVGAGAAGTSEIAKTLHPAVKVRFMR